ncbi:hypothetical protein [Bernardetia sp.]|uniref:hypothetical protein n=1 Tax=Bernardetia sp. TaxID=1937974 RepID=UPI0025BF99D3|nr:hypothetical protein [Bernardetia sp.]
MKPKPISKINDLQELEDLHKQAHRDIAAVKDLQNGQKLVEEIRERIKAIKKRKIDLK